MRCGKTLSGYHWIATIGVVILSSQRCVHDILHWNNLNKRYQLCTFSARWIALFSHLTPSPLKKWPNYIAICRKCVHWAILSEINLANIYIYIYMCVCVYLYYRMLKCAYSINSLAFDDDIWCQLIQVINDFTIEIISLANMSLSLQIWEYISWISYFSCLMLRILYKFCFNMYHEMFHYYIFNKILTHYIDVIMTTIASQITSLTVVYSIVYSDVDQRKHPSSASLAFVRGIHRDRWITRTNGR